MPTFDVTFDIAIPGIAVRTLTRPITAPDLEQAIKQARTDLIIIVLKSVVQTAP